jgi:inner membrane protein
MNEDYALLAGSIGLFVLLALVMWVTRRVDWNRLDARGQAPV